MDSITISVDQLADTLENELNTYNKNVIDGVKKESKKSMDKLVQETKATAPVGHRKKHYKDSISSKQTADTPLIAEYTWYVKGSDYRLSHLLENGHATRNGGRTKAYHFIRNATDKITEEYLEKVKEVCENNGNN